MFLNAIITLIKPFSDVLQKTCTVIKCHENKYKMCYEPPSWSRGKRGRNKIKIKRSDGHINPLIQKSTNTKLIKLLFLLISKEANLQERARPT